MTRPMSSGQFRAMFARPRGRMGDAGADFDAQASQQGGTAGAGAAAGLFGPEAAPVGQIVGSYVGGHAREWASDVWGTVSGWFSSTAACYCQLGACDDNDDWDIGKFNIIRGTCGSPEARAIIDKIMTDKGNALRASGFNVDKANEIENCGKLAAYTECAKRGWHVPQVSAASLFFAKMDADCRSKGYQGWNGQSCAAFPKAPKDSCPGGVSLHSVPGRFMDNGKCIECPNGVRRTAQWGKDTSVPWLECVPMPLAKKVVIGTAAVGTTAAVGWALYTFVPWRRLFG